MNPEYDDDTTTRQALLHYSVVMSSDFNGEQSRSGLLEALRELQDLAERQVARFGASVEPVQQVVQQLMEQLGWDDTTTATDEMLQGVQAAAPRQDDTTTTDESAMQAMLQQDDITATAVLYDMLRINARGRPVCAFCSNQRPATCTNACCGGCCILQGTYHCPRHSS